MLVLEEFTVCGVDRRQTHKQSILTQRGKPSDGDSGKNMPYQPVSCERRRDPVFCDNEGSQNSVLHGLWRTLTLLLSVSTGQMSSWWHFSPATEI